MALRCQSILAAVWCLVPCRIKFHDSLEYRSAAVQYVTAHLISDHSHIYARGNSGPPTTSRSREAQAGWPSGRASTLSVNTTCSFPAPSSSVYHFFDNSAHFLTASALSNE